MGKADAATKIYMRENTVFADAFNFLIYDGKSVVNPDNLRELDTAELTLPFGTKEEKGTHPEDAVQKYRDILKSAVIKQDDKAAYILLGIENQTGIHYAIPVKNLIYDGLQYGKQVTDIAARHRKNKEKGHSGGEYLSGFYKEDKLIPVITLVIHFGADKWDGPLSLHEMMAVKSPNLLSFVQNYQIHLIDPAGIPEEDLKKFSTSLREVLSYIKYSKDPQKLTGLLQNNPRMRLQTEAARVIQTITNTPMKIPEGEEEVDMCEAIEAMIRESTEKGKAEGRAEGRAEGKAEGRAEGKAEGRAEGKVEGREEGIIEILSNLVKDGLLTLKDAAARANMTESAFKAAAQKLS